MEKSTLSIKETLSITFRTLKILFHAAPGGIAFLGILSTIAGVCPFLTLILSRAFLDSLARACGQQAFEMEIICPYRPKRQWKDNPAKTVNEVI